MINYRELGNRHKDQYPAGVELVNDFVSSLQKRGLLPKRFPQSVDSKAPEQMQTINFSEKTKEALTSDGAVLYLPKSKSLKDQQREGRNFGFIVDASSRRFLTLRARPIEVAIYPDPQRFFVPESFNKAKNKQEELVKDDADALRKRLGVEDITEIIPEVSEATEILFEHLGEAGIRLLGKDYDYLYMRTNTPTNESGSYVASVGYFSALIGPYVLDWNVDEGFPSIGAARWVVPAQIEN